VHELKEKIAMAALYGWGIKRFENTTGSWDSLAFDQYKPS